MYDFEVMRPTSLEDALAALQDEDALALAGGQTLIPTLKARLAMPSRLVSLGAIPQLQGICIADDGAVCIGGATSHAKVAADDKVFAGLRGLAGQIGDPAVRNRGTIGGSLANNDPAACYPAAALGTGATIITDRREIAADDFFQGMFTTALAEGEIITEIRFPVPQVSAYVKQPQPASRFAMVGVFVGRYQTGVRVAVTGASDRGVFRWTEAEKALTAEFAPGAVAALSVAADGMLHDLHGSSAYRAHLVKTMTVRAVKAAA